MSDARLGSLARAFACASSLTACHGCHGASTPATTTTDSGVSADAPDAAPSSGDWVTTFHAHASRDGVYVQPSLDAAHASKLVRDGSFDGTVSGIVRAQPLYVPRGQGGMFVVATETNDVVALDESNGKPLWTKNLGPAPVASGAGCGNVSPLGVTGTPVADLASSTLYVVSVLGTGTDAGSIIQTYLVHALSLDDGSERAGWPVDLAGRTSGSHTFTPKVENQRGALLLLNGNLYVPFGGHYGDCGPYQGWLFGIDVANPKSVVGFATSSDGGGMWAPGGATSDGASVFVATGNTKGAAAWSGGEAVFRFDGSATFSGNYADYWAPTNWQSLDNGDVDIGGTAPVPLDLPGATPSKLVLAMGKDGILYVLDRGKLGGISAPIAKLQVGGTDAELINAPAIFTTPTGAWVALRRHDSGSLTGCPGGVTNADLGVVRIDPASPPSATLVWCAQSGGMGSPIVTTTDASGSNAIVWAVGAEGSERLLGWNATTGAPVYAGGAAGDALGTVRRFAVPIAAKGRVLVAGDGKLYAFAPKT
jgi:hypothetical protein